MEKFDDKAKQRFLEVLEDFGLGRAKLSPLDCLSGSRTHAVVNSCLRTGGVTPFRLRDHFVMG
ncbi:hypothetical protein LJR143_003643 [Pseudoxanthomonas sp. LjRoot143]|uniref:hypothetical protein n=1 Tax=Pseudoxanthomonas sp. LjRoot143 TaxID=3342266 RepID=UPI003ECDE7C1